MGDFYPQCPKCERPMDRGHVPDLAHGSVLTAGWAPGEPVPRRFVGGIKYDRDEVIPFTAYRCPGCGFVEFYASPA